MSCPIPEANLPDQVRKAVSPTAPLPQRLIAARALAPLRPADLVLALFCLLYDTDEKVRTSAVTSLNKLPEPILKVAVGANLPGPVFEYLARGLTGRTELLQTIVLNPAVKDETIVMLAGIVDGSVLEIIGNNQQRILRHPEIADAVLMNPSTPGVLSTSLTEFAQRNGLKLAALGHAPEPEPEPEPVPWTTAEPEPEPEWEPSPAPADGAVRPATADDGLAAPAEPDALEDGLRQSSMLMDDEDGDLDGPAIEFDVAGGAAVETLRHDGLAKGSELEEVDGSVFRQRGMLDDDEDEDELLDDLKDEAAQGGLEFDVQGGGAVQAVGEAGIRQHSMLMEDDDPGAEAALEAEEAEEELVLEFPSFMLDEGREFSEDERQSAEQMLKNMNAAEKIKLAALGNREVRGVLLRDSNKMIAVAAASSPKLSEQEMVAIAGSRSVTDDVIRYAANSRDYTKLYQVKANLVQNPKTPPGISLRFLNHLREPDLRKVASSKNVPSVVATTAKKKMKAKKKS